MQRYFNKFAVIFFIIIVLLIIGCGIGPSNGDDTDSGEGDPAQISLTISPSVIDSGDTIKVSVEIYEIESQAIVVKVRFPKELSYILDSSSLTVDDIIYDAGPQDNESDSNYTYLVYYFTEEDFNFNSEGLLELTLKGDSNVASGAVAIDTDIDDADIPNNQEFDVTNPQFDGQASQSVRVGPASSSSSSGGSSSSRSSSSTSSTSSSSSSSSS